VDEGHRTLLELIPSYHHVTGRLDAAITLKMADAAHCAGAASGLEGSACCEGRDAEWETLQLPKSFEYMPVVNCSGVQNGVR
jgi:hypothetical protein